MSEEHSLAAEIARLNEFERHIVDRFIHQRRVARDLSLEPTTVGERIADRVASFGGSWRFIGIAIAAIVAWLYMNSRPGNTFDPFPFILLNLVLSCLAALQAPIIMMSQNRSEARDRLRAENDYKVNLKAELEIRHLHEKIDHLLRKQYNRLFEIQQIQIELLEEISQKRKT